MAWQASTRFVARYSARRLWKTSVATPDPGLILDHGATRYALEAPRGRDAHHPSTTDLPASRPVGAGPGVIRHMKPRVQKCTRAMDVPGCHGTCEHFKVTSCAQES